MKVFDKIYAAVLTIPRGHVASYGQVAEAAGSLRYARAVGYALHRNPRPGEIPCHRVVMKDGSVSPAFAFGGKNEQIRLLEEEGVEFADDGRVVMERFCVRALPSVIEEEINDD